MKNEKVKLNYNANVTKILRILFWIVFCCGIVGYTMLIVKCIRHSVYYYNWFGDFAEVVFYNAVKNPYNGSSGITAIYPAISFRLFYPFYLICKRDVDALMRDGYVYDDILAFANSKLCLFSYLLYFVVNLVLIMFVLAKITKFKGKNLFYLLGIVAFCGPMFFMFQRGNVLITTLLFVLVFFWLYSSPVRWKRELSLVALAFAISIKIFPVLIAIILLKDKRFLDIFKLAIYSIILAFVPFVFVQGGMIDNVKLIIKRYLASSEGGINTMFVGASACFDKMFDCFYFYITGRTVKSQMVLKVFTPLTWLVKITVVVLTLVAIFKTKDKNKQMPAVMMVLCCHFFVESISGGYNYVYLLIPLALFLLELKQYSKKEVLFFAINFAIVFFPITYCVRNCILQYISTVAMWIYCFALCVKKPKQQQNLTQENNQQKITN